MQCFTTRKVERQAIANKEWNEMGLATKEEDLHFLSGGSRIFCLKCGVDDPLEAAIYMGWFNVWEKIWDSEEHQNIVEKLLICRVKGRVEWNSTEYIWELIPSKEE